MVKKVETTVEPLMIYPYNITEVSDVKCFMKDTGSYQTDAQYFTHIMGWSIYIKKLFTIFLKIP